MVESSYIFWMLMCVALAIGCNWKCGLHHGINVCLGRTLTFAVTFIWWRFLARNLVRLCARCVSVAQTRRSESCTCSHQSFTSRATLLLCRCALLQRIRRRSWLCEWATQYEDKMRDFSRRCTFLIIRIGSIFETVRFLVNYAKHVGKTRAQHRIQ